MKPKNERIEKEVFRAMQALDELGRIECRPDFDFRLQAKIRQQAEKRNPASWRPLTGRYLLPALLVILLALNVITAIAAFRRHTRLPDERQRMLAGLAAEYSLSGDRLDSWIAKE